jgi:hypothetical protein
MQEGSTMNKSLLTLGRVISALSKAEPKLAIPVLTRLLKESLGGNSKKTNVEETLITLRYAEMARKIINVARVNKDPKAKQIRALRTEVELESERALPAGHLHPEEQSSEQ